MEMFAGVGGFRLGLEKADSEFYNTVWANQWEPSRKSQEAVDCYKRNFNSGELSNEDISIVEAAALKDKNIDLLVGGFPCQNYSVARGKKGEEGIKGEKGVLFWDIVRMVRELKPKYLLLENVNRLLISPSFQRGRDFGVMLTT